MWSLKLGQSGPGYVFDKDRCRLCVSSWCVGGGISGLCLIFVRYGARNAQARQSRRWVSGQPGVLRESEKCSLSNVFVA